MKIDESGRDQTDAALRVRTDLRAGFAEVSGLDSETTVVEYQDGNDLILRRGRRA